MRPLMRQSQAAGGIGAYLSVANMYRADLTGAIWTDGRTCRAKSIGVCQ